MIYLVFYINKDMEYCSQIVQKGFSCKASELENEIKHYVGARKLLKVEGYMSYEAAKANADYCIPQFKLVKKVLN